MYSNSSISCSEIYNVTGNTYDVESPDGGIPENLGINFAIWVVRGKMSKILTPKIV
jgi:hypothetical protein